MSLTIFTKHENNNKYKYVKSCPTEDMARTIQSKCKTKFFVSQTDFEKILLQRSRMVFSIPPPMDDETISMFIHMTETDF